MLSSLVALFNRLFNLGSAPAAWGKALVVLLYKDGDRADPGNYRGISLLDIVGKVFSKVMASRLDAALTMSPEQAGFTAGMGCMHNLHVLLQVLQKRKYEGKDTFLFVFGCA